MTPPWLRLLASVPLPAEAPMPDWKNREEDYRKRSAGRARHEAQQKQAQAECTWARDAKVKLEKAGRLDVMSEADRRSERQRADTVLSHCV